MHPKSQAGIITREGKWDRVEETQEIKWLTNLILCTALIGMKDLESCNGQSLCSENTVVTFERVAQSQLVIKSMSRSSPCVAGIAVKALGVELKS